MIPKILSKMGVEIGLLIDLVEGYTIEERNGMCELEMVYPIFSENWTHLVRGNIVVADQNDVLKEQKYRIYKVTKPFGGLIQVYARHISFDLARDIIEDINLENASCEYALNELFRNSQFSQHFKGKSDIVNAQNFNLKNTNLLKSIAGTKGSIIDIYGTGAEILRDNNIISILNKRGHDNDVSIEYAKNMTGLEIDLDDSNLITRIKGYAKYNNEENEEVIVHSEPKYVDSYRINDYETPFIQEIDFSDKFEEGQVPTPTKLRDLALRYFEENKCDLVKENIKVEFIPLSKCVGYEGIADKISLCDTVRIIDSRYNLDTKAKVIKATYNILTERYEKMELGEPRTFLGDLIGSGSDGVEVSGDSTTKPPIIGDNSFPNTLPQTPVLEFKLYGFDRVGLSWTFENKIYYSYELYASRIKDFTPNVFDLIHSDNSSGFQHVCKPSEVWYYRVRAINTHGKATTFSNQVEVETVKIENLENYVSSAAIGDALIGELNLGRGWIGQLNAQLLDVKGNFSVTDGNGKRTMDIDSFGNITLLPTNFKMLIDGKEEAAVTQSSFNATVEGINMNVSKKADTKEVNSLITQKADQITQTVSTVTKGNLISNGGFESGLKNWGVNGSIEANTDQNWQIYDGKKTLFISAGKGGGVYQAFKTAIGKKYVASFYAMMDGFGNDNTIIGIEDIKTVNTKDVLGFKKFTIEFTATKTSHSFIAYSNSNLSKFFLDNVMVNEGMFALEFTEKVVNESNIVSSINQTAEAVKIQANKIQLEGATTIGDSSGNHVKIENANYTILNNGQQRGFIGFKNMGNNFDKYVVPKLALGAYGYASNHNYFTVIPYRGGDNPQNISNAYVDIAYHCISNDDWSNIKMYDGGDIRLAPLKELEITTNYLNGSYAGTEERRLALFATSTVPYFNSNLQIGCTRNMTNDYGYIIADDHVAGAETRVRCHTDSSRQKFFRPCDNVADINNGSASFPWKSVTSKTAYVTDNLISNPMKTIGENGNILDNIHFVQARGLDEPIKMDVSAISGSAYAPVEEEVQVIDTTELLKLALMEIKKLKEEMKILKGYA